MVFLKVPLEKLLKLSTTMEVYGANMNAQVGLTNPATALMYVT
jgi:glycine cleavage system protein P-like pyridoxal-binding family